MDKGSRRFLSCCIMVHFQIKKFHMDLMVRNRIFLYREMADAIFRCIKLLIRAIVFHVKDSARVTEKSDCGGQARPRPPQMQCVLNPDQMPPMHRYLITW
ncbi:hypothetical protein BCF11_2037 [Collimonas sp. PA-H2]|nr:hypothetical protein BCF11_2037 [Collimonas sp. PA-H2]